MPVAVLDQELSSREGLVRHRVPFQNREGAEGIVVKTKSLRVRGVDHHRLGRGVLLVKIRGLVLRHDIGAGLNFGDYDLSILVCGIKAIAGGESLIIGEQLSISIGNFEPCSGQGFLGDLVILFDNEPALRSIGHDDRLGVSVGANYHVFAGFVHDIACRGLDFRQHIRAGSKIGNPNLTVGICGKNAVLRERSGTNHAVQTHLAASGSCHTELSAGEGLAADAVPLLDNQFSLGLVFEGQADRPALLNLDGLRLRVNDESVRGLGLRYDHALARLQTLNADFSVGVGPVNPIGITNQSSVRVGDLELGVLEGDAGVDGADLPDEEISVRRIIKGHSNDILHAVVRNVDRFRGIDDGIPISGVDLLHDIGARSEARPDAGAVFPGDLLPDDRAARAGGAAQEAELEGAARQGLAGNRVILLNDDPV